MELVIKKNKLRSNEAAISCASCIFAAAGDEAA
jgi:hypothetical protein